MNPYERTWHHLFQTLPPETQQDVLAKHGRFADDFAKRVIHETEQKENEDRNPVTTVINGQSIASSY